MLSLTVVGLQTCGASSLVLRHTGPGTLTGPRICQEAGGQQVVA